MPVGPDEGGRVVEDLRVVGVALDHAHGDVEVVLGAQFGDAFGRGAGHGLGQPVVVVAVVDLLSTRSAPAEPGQCFLGKDEDVDALGAGFADVGLDLRERGGHVAAHAGEVHDTDRRGRLVVGVALRDKAHEWAPLGSSPAMVSRCMMRRDV